MLNTPKTTNKKPSATFGEKYIIYLNNIASAELIIGIFVSVLIFIQAMQISLGTDIEEKLRSTLIALSFAICASSIITYIFIIAIQHILNNSIENRKMLTQLLNQNTKKTQE